MASNSQAGDLLNIAELAQYLKVPRSWIYRHTTTKGGDRIPHLRAGRHLRFRAEDVVLWLEKAAKQKA